MNAKQLREALERLEISQLTAARWAGVHARTMRRYVLGERPIPNMLVELVRSWLTDKRNREGTA